MSARNRLYRERLRAGRKCLKSTTWAATGPRLREVLKRTGEIIVCPELDALARSGVTRTSERANVRFCGRY